MGRFEIVRLLGRGSMGAVYLARDPLLDREVAVKTLSGDFSVSPAGLVLLRRRLLNEARSAGTLRHPGIVTIYDVIEESEGRIAIAMEFVRGRTLAEEMARRRPLPLLEVSEIATQVAETLDHAHGRNVVHRDIKPANVLLTDDGGVKIADFGIASLRGDDLASELNALGTPNYLAPERILGAAADRRSDIYAFGVVVFEMLTGALPFAGKTMGELARSVVRDEPADPLTARPDLPERITGLLARALAKSPDERFQTASELAAELAASIQVEAAFSATVRMPPPGELGLDSVDEEQGAETAVADPGDTRAVRAPWRAMIDAAWRRAATRVAALARRSQRSDRRELGRLALPAAAVALGAGLVGLAVFALGRDGTAAKASETLERSAVLANAERLAAVGAVEEAVEELRRGADSLAESGELAAAIREARETAAARRKAELRAEVRANFEDAQLAFDRRDLGATEEALVALLEIEPEHEGGVALSAAVEALRAALTRPAPRAEPAPSPRAPPPSLVPDPEPAPAARSLPEPEVEPAPEPAYGTLRIEFESLRSKGVLTVYANGEQILRRGFRFAERTGLLRRRPTKGGFGASMRLPKGEVDLRVYLALPGRASETRLFQLDLPGGAVRVLRLGVTADGSLRAEAGSWPRADGGGV